MSIQLIPRSQPDHKVRLALRTFAALQKRYPLLQLVALVVAFAYGAHSLPGLATWTSIKTILVLASLVGLAALGQTVVILIGGFNLSVAGVIVMSAVTVTELRAQRGWSFELALILAIVVAGFMGALSGYICHRFNVPSLIVTLAMGSIAIGSVQVQAAGLASGSAPAWLQELTSPRTDTVGLDVPPLVVIWAVVAVLAAIFFHRTSAGRHLLATGANLRAADYSLIRTRRVWTLAFAFSAVASALVGILIAGFVGTVDPSVGDPYIFGSLVAVIVGGTTFGGPGDYTRTVLGALFIQTLSIILIGHGLSRAWEYIVYGLVLLIAVATYSRGRNISDSI